MRIRSIKPETWTDPAFVACSPLARLLWIGTWNHADDYGVLKDDPERLKLQILPNDDCDPRLLVDELVSARLLLRQIAPDGTRVLVVRTFCVHQKIDTRAIGRWGNPDAFDDPPVSNQSHPNPTKSNHTKGREGKGKPIRAATVPPTPGPASNGRAASPRLGDDPPGFPETWEHYPRKLNRKGATKAFQARLRAGILPDQLLQATRNYATAMAGKDPQYVMHGKTFYGPDDRWRDYLNQTTPTRPPPDPTAYLPDGGALTATPEQLGIAGAAGGTTTP